MPKTKEHERVVYGEAALSMYDDYKIGNADHEMTPNDEGRTEFSDELASILTDLLTDLRHYCEAADIDFGKAVDTSYSHYLVERKGE